MNANAKPKLTGRRFLILACRLAFLAWLVLTLWPVSYGITRLAQVLLVLALWTGGMILWWQIKLMRWGLVAAAVFCAGLVLLPGRASSASELRERYVNELQNYEGVRYVWGGENGFGIDCSGLIRRAMIQSLWKHGLQTANAGLVRAAARLWWHDASARAMAAEYRNDTKKLFEVSSIQAHGADGLLPGDLAVTSDGVHVLAFLGGNQWIEADPSAGKVLKLEAGTTVNRWLNLPVMFVRWRLLDQQLEPQPF
ncbi:MAG: C40 family peptidase [Verrucomicrobia bacterium]|nr:C40 family peptidase [Verrucomicrobiota bacterium]